MTEQELIELLENHFPNELTPEIINRLKALLKTSPKMRQAILATLKIEQALSVKYAKGGNFRVFMRKVQVVANAQRRASKLRTAIVAAVIVLILAGGGLTVWLSWDKLGPAGQTGNPDAGSGGTGVATPIKPAQQVATPEAQNPTAPDNRPDNEGSQSVQLAVNAPPWRLYDYPLLANDKEWRDSIDKIIKPLADKKQMTFDENQRLVPIDGRYKFLLMPSSERTIRLGIREPGWQISIFSGKEAVVLKTLQNDETLSGYVAERGKDDAAVNLQLVTTDNYLRTHMNYSPLDIYYGKRKITVASGGVILMSLPISGQPTDMFMEGRTRMYFIESRPGSEPPANQLSLQSSPARNDTPDKFDWKLEPSFGWSHVKAKDGAIEILSATKDLTRIAIMDYTPEPGDEITFKIDAASPGTGIALRDMSNGLTCPEMIYDLQSRRVLAGNLNDFSMQKNRPNEVAKALQEGKVVNESFWVRFQFGFYHYAIQVSNDGQSWWTAWLSHFQNDTTLDKLAVALVATGVDPKQKIRLSRVSIVKNDSIKKLYDQPLTADVTKLSAFKKANDFADVDKELMSSKPSGVPEWKWRNACFAALMLKPVPVSVRHMCLIEMVNNSVRYHFNTEDAANAVLQLPKFIAWNNSFTTVVNLYNNLVQRMGPDNYQRLLDMWRTNLPRGLNERTNYMFPLMLTREYLIQLWAKQDWEALRLITLQLLFHEERWMGHEDKTRFLYQMSQWLGAMAWMKLPEQGVTPPSFVGSWNPPLQIGASREILNALSEFESAVQAGAGEFDAAIKVLIRQPLGDDLVPSGLEENLYNLPETAVRRIIGNSPDFQQDLKGRMAGLGVIMLNKARQEQDIASIRTVSVLFADTKSGSDALEYLADRDLLIGNYASAASFYKQLQTIPGRSSSQGVEAKHRLAAAMMGEQVGKPVATDVILPGGKLSAQDFESVISTLGSQQGQSLGNLAADKENVQGLAPGPCSIDFKSIGQIGPMTELVKQEHQFNYSWQQIAAWAPGPDRIFINTAGKLSAVNPQDAREFWAQQSQFKPPQPNAGYNDYCTPLVAGDSIFTRLFREGRMDLVCANTANGSLKWKSPLDDGVACDPFIISPWLYVLTRKNVVGDLIDVCLHRISPKTGESVQSTRVIRMKQGNWPLYIGQPTICGDMIVFKTVGAAVCCDVLGKPRWVRQLPFVPPNVYDLQYSFLKPSQVQAVDNGIYFISPGCPYVTALDITTGKMLWQFQNAAARRIVGLFGNRLVFATAEELICLDLRSGRCNWRMDLPAYDSAVIPAENDSLMLVRIRTGPDNLPNIFEQSYVAWISAAEGKVLRLEKLPELKSQGALNLFVYKKDVYGLSTIRGNDNINMASVFLIKKK